MIETLLKSLTLNNQKLIRMSPKNAQQINYSKTINRFLEKPSKVTWFWCLIRWNPLRIVRELSHRSEQKLNHPYVNHASRDLATLPERVTQRSTKKTKSDRCTFCSRLCASGLIWAWLLIFWIWVSVSFFGDFYFRLDPLIWINIAIFKKLFRTWLDKKLVLRSIYLFFKFGVWAIAFYYKIWVIANNLAILDYFNGFYINDVIAQLSES
jgi:hypothetical protein